MHDIADAVYVNEHIVLAIGVDHAAEFADHVLRLLPPLSGEGRPSEARTGWGLAQVTPTRSLTLASLPRKRGREEKK
jgi:hypothetical protein